MASIDIKALQWNAFFQKIPNYPQLLTQKNWDKKKGKIAKMAGATGMGDQLKACEAAFKKMDNNWVFIQGQRVVDIDKEKKDALAFIKGTPLKNLHEEFRKLRELAKKTRDRFKKKKLIPKSASNLCEEIREAADILYVITGANTLMGHLDVAETKHLASLIEKQKRFAGTVVSACKTVPAKIDKATKDWRKVLKACSDNEEKMEKVRSTLKGQMFSRARDMTQAVANFEKCVKAGVEWENYNDRGMKALVTTLVAYGNGQGVDLAGMSAAEIENHVKVIADGGVEFNRLTKDVKIRGT